ncbi:FMN-binding negative transcriptional regulator [Flavihumibacter sp. ZG627]|uniref:FMN-binding negative transcriptional regulator n=1 Tax=Flavihumibacter sp. ZG627 TaxID=1463156 RepID=UPI00058072D8|nr:FMN-binding negative transcriptional regulator [Flavihumibacter sp. ZG627]KIC89089.1 transcriptional regulator [Flavihumibacter sp. ZG627]
MYIPKHFSEEDLSKILSFMKEFSFATIVSMQDSIPVATHLPFVLEEREDKIILVAHFARANEQWKEIDQQTVLVIFSEPHAYISPGHYETELNVPTWNYVAVHAYGKVEIIDDKQKTIEVLEKTIRNYEAGYEQQWSQLPEKYRDGMLKGIVAFEVTVTDLQAKYKLSQNRTEKERAAIMETLKNSKSAVEYKVGEMMENRRTFH